jgi:hypothetical protein
MWVTAARAGNRVTVLSYQVADELHAEQKLRTRSVI